MGSRSFHHGVHDAFSSPYPKHQIAIPTIWMNSAGAPGAVRRLHTAVARGIIEASESR